ncbi:MAG TPA: ABC transporter substrate-binding protein [Candidatus Binatia bacterium]|jgi:NitT/TauT family transport system substrate-binding protein
MLADGDRPNYRHWLSANAATKVTSTRFFLRAWCNFLLVGIFAFLSVRCDVQAQTRIVQAIPTKSFGYLPLFVAQQNGFYSDEGLEVIAPVVRSAVALPGLLSGEIQFASAESGMRVAMRGTPVKGIVFYYDRATWVLLGRPEIRSIRDLNGKNIAINSFGAGADFTTREILRANGLQEKDYKLVALGQDSQRILALMNNQVQATLLNPDTAAIAETQIEGIRRLAHAGDFQKTPFSGFVVAEKLLSENRQLVKRFVRATVKAILLSREQPQQAARVAEKVFGMKPEIATSAVRNTIPAISAKDPGGFTDVGITQFILQNAKAMSVRAEDVRIPDVADLTLLREVQRELGIMCEGGYGCKK